MKKVSIIPDGQVFVESRIERSEEDRVVAHELTRKLSYHGNSSVTSGKMSNLW